MTTTDEQLTRNCKHIAEELSNPDQWRNEYAADREGVEVEEVGAMDWLEDVLDINYIINSDGTFKSARVLVAFGGPNIWVDFETGKVEGYWGGDRATANFVDTLNVEEALEELWQSR